MFLRSLYIYIVYSILPCSLSHFFWNIFLWVRFHFLLKLLLKVCYGHATQEAAFFVLFALKSFCAGAFLFSFLGQVLFYGSSSHTTLLSRLLIDHGEHPTVFFSPPPHPLQISSNLSLPVVKMKKIRENEAENLKMKHVAAPFKIPSCLQTNLQFEIFVSSFDKKNCFAPVYVTPPPFLFVV